MNSAKVGELKALAMAVKGQCDHQHNVEQWVAFRYAASPTLVLELIARIEKLEVMAVSNIVGQWVYEASPPESFSSPIAGLKFWLGEFDGSVFLCHGKGNKHLYNTWDKPTTAPAEGEGGSDG